MCADMGMSPDRQGRAGLSQPAAGGGVVTAALDAGMEASGAPPDESRLGRPQPAGGAGGAAGAAQRDPRRTARGPEPAGDEPALARLRGMFNDDLLVRTSAGPTLTARGEQLRARLPSALGVIREILVSRSFSPEEAKSKVTVAMPEHQALVLLPRLLPRLRSRAPNLDLVVSPLLAGSLKRLESGEIDLAVGQVDGTPSGFFRRTLYTDRVRLPAAPRSSVAAA